jgi:hypothetical protein
MAWEATVSLECSNDVQAMLEELRAFRDKMQAFCFHWKTHHRRGMCKEINGHYCCFCELCDEFEREILGEQAPERSK